VVIVIVVWCGHSRHVTETVQVTPLRTTLASSP